MTESLKINTENMAELLGVDESLIIDDLNMTDLEKEQNPYTKSDLSGTETVLRNGGKRVDSCKTGETIEALGGSLSSSADENGNITYHYKSDYLGEFDYNPQDFALGYKALEDGSQLPVLSYIGDSDGVNHIFKENKEDVGHWPIEIPEGLKNMDYMFEGNTDLLYVPLIPSSVESMHYSFAGCENLAYSMHTDRLGTYPGKPKGFVNFVESFNRTVNGQTSLVVLPDGLEDMSGAFKGCSKLSAAFTSESGIEDNEQKNWTKFKNDEISSRQLLAVVSVFDSVVGEYKLPESLLNIRDAFNGCDNIESVTLKTLANKAVYPKYGKDITPYLTSEFAKGALDNISEAGTFDKNIADKIGQDVKDVSDNTEYNITDHGRTADMTNIENPDEEKTQQSQIAAESSYIADVASGKVDSNNELASGGSREHNLYYDAADSEIHDDLSGLLESDNAMTDGVKGMFQHAVIDAATAGILYGTSRLAFESKTLSKVVAVAGTAALDYFNVIPETFAPVLDFTANVMPDGAVKDKLLEWRDKFTSTTHDKIDSLTEENVAATYQNRRLQRSFVAVGAAYEVDIEKSLYENAKYAGANLNFKATADKAADKGVHSAIDGMDAYVEKSIESVTSHWNEAIANGSDINALKSNMKDYYLELAKGLESYNKGGLEGIAGIESEPYKIVSQEGLSMVNRQYARDVVESIKEMDDKYHFMDDEAWNEIKGIKAEGCDMSEIIDNIDDTAYFENKDLDSVKKIDEARVDDPEYVTGEAVEMKDGKPFRNYGNGQFEGEEKSVASVGTTQDSVEKSGAKADVTGENMNADKGDTGNKNVENTVSETAKYNHENDGIEGFDDYADDGINADIEATC